MSCLLTVCPRWPLEYLPTFQTASYFKLKSLKSSRDDYSEVKAEGKYNLGISVVLQVLIISNLHYNYSVFFILHATEAGKIFDYGRDTVRYDRA